MKKKIQAPCPRFAREFQTPKITREEEYVFVHSNEKRLANINMLSSTGALATCSPRFLRQCLCVCTVNCSPPSLKRDCDFIYSILRPDSQCNSKICDCNTARYAITQYIVWYIVLYNVLCDSIFCIVSYNVLCDSVFLQYYLTFIPRLLVILAYFCSIT